MSVVVRARVVRRSHRSWQVRALRWLSVVVVLGVLELGARLGWLDVLTWVPLVEVFQHLVEGITSGEFAEHWGRSLTGIALSFVLAVGLGVPIGYLLWRVPAAYRALEVYLESYYALPLFVFYPVAVALMGLHIWSIVLIVWFWAVGGVIVNTVIGFHRTPRSILKYSRSLGLNRMQEFRCVLLPSASPSILTGVKLAVVYSIAGTIGSEFILSATGVGHLINQHYNSFATADMYAVIISVLALALFAHWALSSWEDAAQSRRGHIVDPYSSVIRPGLEEATTRAGSRRIMEILFAPLFLLLSWYLASFIASPNFLAYPHTALAEMVEGLLGGRISSAIGLTLRNTFLAMLISTVLGVFVGYVLGTYRFLSEVFEGWIMGLYTTPKVVLYPLLLFAFGFSDSARVTFGVLHALPVILIFTIAAVRAVNPAHLKVARALQLGGPRLFRYITFPSSLPEVITGLRFGLSLSFLGVLVSEMLIGASHGAGFEILSAALRGDVAFMLAVVLVVMVLAVTMNAVMARVEKLARA